MSAQEIQSETLPEISAWLSSMRAMSRAADLMHDPEQRHQVRSTKSGGRTGTLPRLDGLQTGHGIPEPLQPSCSIGLSGCSSQIQRMS